MLGKNGRSLYCHVRNRGQTQQTAPKQTKWIWLQVIPHKFEYLCLGNLQMDSSALRTHGKIFLLSLVKRSQGRLQNLESQPNRSDLLVDILSEFYFWDLWLDLFVWPYFWIRRSGVHSPFEGFLLLRPQNRTLHDVTVQYCIIRYLIWIVLRQQIVSDRDSPLDQPFNQFQRKRPLSKA